jgi:hypothetical protein
VNVQRPAAVLPSRRKSFKDCAATGLFFALSLVIPAQAGIQFFLLMLLVLKQDQELDPRLRGDDKR